MLISLRHNWSHFDLGGFTIQTVFNGEFRRLGLTYFGFFFTGSVHCIYHLLEHHVKNIFDLFDVHLKLLLASLCIQGDIKAWRRMYLMKLFFRLYKSDPTWSDKLGLMRWAFFRDLKTDTSNSYRFFAINTMLKLDPYLKKEYDPRQKISSTVVYLVSASSILIARFLLQLHIDVCRCASSSHAYFQQVCSEWLHILEYQSLSAGLSITQVTSGKTSSSSSLK